MIFISTYSYFLKSFIFSSFLLLEDYKQGAPWNKSVTATFTEWFEIAALRKSYW